MRNQIEKKKRKINYSKVILWVGVFCTILFIGFILGMFYQKQE